MTVPLKVDLVSVLAIHCHTFERLVVQTSRLVQPHVPWLYQGGLDPKGVYFVQHTLYKTFGSVLRRAVRSKTRDSKSAGRGGEYQIAACVLALFPLDRLFSEVR